MNRVSYDNLYQGERKTRLAVIFFFSKLDDENVHMLTVDGNKKGSKIITTNNLSMGLM